MSSQILYEDMISAYYTSEVTPAEYVASIGVDGFNMEEVVEAYAMFMKAVEEDDTLRINLEEETVVSVTDGKASELFEIAEVDLDDGVVILNIL